MVGRFPSRFGGFIGFIFLGMFGGRHLQCHLGRALDLIPGKVWPGLGPAPV